MINIFGGSDAPVTKESIAVKASGALGMFRTAIGQLEESNDQAETLRLMNQTTIDELSADNNELETLVTKNSKVIGKIANLIG